MYLALSLLFLIVTNIPGEEHLTISVMRQMQSNLRCTIGVTQKYSMIVIPRFLVTLTDGGQFIVTWVKTGL